MSTTAPRVTVACVVCGVLFQPSGKKEVCGSCSSANDGESRQFFIGVDNGRRAAEALALALASPKSAFARGFRTGYQKAQEELAPR